MRTRIPKQVGGASTRSTRTRPTHRNYSSSSRGNASEKGLFSNANSSAAQSTDPQVGFDYGANDFSDPGESSEETIERIKASEYHFGSDNDDAENILDLAISRFSYEERQIIPQDFLESCVKQSLEDTNIQPNVTCVSAGSFNYVVAHSRYIANKKIKDMTPNEYVDFVVNTFPEDVRPLLRLACKDTLDTLKTYSDKDTALGPDPLKSVCELSKKMENSLNTRWLTKEEAKSVIPSVRKLAEPFVNELPGVLTFHKGDGAQMALQVCKEYNPFLGGIIEKGLNLATGEYLKQNFDKIISNADRCHKALILKLCSKNSEDELSAEDLYQKLSDPKYSIIALLITLLITLYALYKIKQEMSEFSHKGKEMLQAMWDILEKDDTELLEQLKLDLGEVRVQIEELKGKIQTQEGKKTICDVSKDYLNWDKHHQPEKGWNSYFKSYFTDTSVSKFCNENKGLNSTQKSELIKSVETRVDKAKNGKFKDPIEDIAQDLSVIDKELKNLSTQIVEKQKEELGLLKKSEEAVEHLNAFKKQLEENSYSCGM